MAHERRSPSAFVARFCGLDPPARSGLRPGDVILEIGGSKVQSVEALVDRVEGLKGREKLEIVLIRAGGDDTPEKLVIGLKTA